MKRNQILMLLMIAGLTGFWAYNIINTLLQEFANEIKAVDLAAIFVMGMFSGLMLGLALAIWRKKSLPD